MNCEFQIKDQNSDKTILLCRLCEREVTVPKRVGVNLKRECTKKVEKFPFLFVDPCSIEGKEIKSWSIYFMTKEFAKNYGELLKEDDSKVGTSLSSLFSFVGAKPTAGCNCKNLQKLLDTIQLPLIKKYKKKLANLIKDSSKTKVPHWLINLALTGAITYESIKIYKRVD